jgi:hypothetical protein
MEASSAKTAVSLGMHQEEPFTVLVKGGQITIQPGGTFNADDGRTVTFNPSVKFTGGKNDKYGRYVFPAASLIEMIDDKEAISKLRMCLRK